MIKDFIVIDNIFENPHIFVDMAKKLTYYHKNVSNKNLGLNLHDDEKNSDARGFWKGYRSEYLNMIDEDLFKNSAETLLSHMLSDFNCHPITAEYNIAMHLHFTPSSVTGKRMLNWHTDEGSVFAGVVYLNENPGKNSGTMLIVDGKEVVIENVFNRFVLYRSSIHHRLQGTFGSTVDDMRLTLTIFFKEFALHAIQNSEISAVR